jgi:S1-C subfamily serine protease
MYARSAPPGARCVSHRFALPRGGVRRILALGLLALAAGTAWAHADESAPSATDADAKISQRVEGAVVKIFATTRYPDLNRPWTKQAPSDITGSGVVIDGHRILTNAHVVLYASQLQVQANQEGDKYSANVIAVAPGMDLAVLSLDDQSFFDRHPPLQSLSALPAIKDPVLVYGFPVGGTSLSITKGIVSRIEFAGYNATTSGLRVQIDAAINPGNSGGPATVGDKMIGLAFSQLGNAQNIGYIIPSEEIDLFLHDIADGHYDGKPTMHEELQTLESSALRTYLGLDAAVHGVVVHRPLLPAGSGYPLHEWDVITAIDGVPVDDQGMILVGKQLHVGLRYQVQRSARDGHIALAIVRAGKAMKIDLPVSVERPSLIQDLKGSYPSYFIYGPIVFSRATTALVFAANQNRDAASMLNFALSPLLSQFWDAPTPAREELVVIPSPFFPHATSKGYGNLVNSVVYSINGVPVRSLKHLVEILRDLKDDYVIIELDNKRGGEGLVFRRKEMVKATDDILSDNGVRAQGSSDMMSVWEAKPHLAAAAPADAGRSSHE